MTGDLNIKQAVPFFRVEDMDASLNFYIKGLGFELINKWEPRGRIAWCWIQLDAVSIMLQEQAKTGAHAILFAENRKGIGVSINFSCRDVIALYHEFTAKGLEIDEPLVGNGLWEIMLTDPDGYKLFFESEASAPEETKYSDWIASKK